MALKILNWDFFRKVFETEYVKAKETIPNPSNLALPLASMRALAATVDHGVGTALEKMEARIDAIESRGIKYCGVHQRALDYKQGDVVTHKGGMWICLRSNNETPGNSDAWQLALRGA